MWSRRAVLALQRGPLRTFCGRKRRLVSAGRVLRDEETSVIDLRMLVRAQRIILVRHGESAGNVDPAAYVNTPDWRIPLTAKGWEDAHRAGVRIKEFIRDGPLYIYTSPYLRTKQTLAGMVGAFDTNEIVGVREEPRLTEQQFGNFQNVMRVRQARELRARFGRFYYRFPEGESGLDVYNRVTSFIATLFRDFANPDIARSNLTVIIITHGLTLRLFLMRFFHYTIHDFEQSHNPRNGAFVVMELVSKGEGKQLREWYELTHGIDALKLPQQRKFGSLWKILQEAREDIVKEEEEAELATLRSVTQADGSSDGDVSGRSRYGCDARETVEEAAAAAAEAAAANAKRDAAIEEDEAWLVRRKKDAEEDAQGGVDRKKCCKPPDW